MGRPRAELSAILNAIPGVKEVYFQAPTNKLEYPCIIYAIRDEYVAHADDLSYFFKLQYVVTVIDRNPDSAIPGAIRDLPYSRFDRKFVTDQLHHTVYELYF